MEEREPSPRFVQLLDQMRATHLRKNAGYAGADQPDPYANFRAATQAGVLASTGCAIRMSDKMSRLLSLIRNPAHEQVGEAITDTALDLAVYAVIYVCLYEEEQRGRNG